MLQDEELLREMGFCMRTLDDAIDVHQEMSFSKVLFEFIVGLMCVEIRDDRHYLVRCACTQSTFPIMFTCALPRHAYS